MDSGSGGRQPYGKAVHGGGLKRTSSGLHLTEPLKAGDVLVYYGTPRKGDRAGQMIATHIAMVGDTDKNGQFVIHNTINSAAKFAGAVKHHVNSVKDYLGYDGTKVAVYRCTDRADIAEKAVAFGNAWVDPVPIIDSKEDFKKAGAPQPVPKASEPCERPPGQPHGDRGVVTAEMNPFLNRPDLSKFRGGRSPYSSERLGVGQQAGPKQWNVMAAFRAVKAYVRTCQSLGLSPRHGTSCDQFVMYCYQAASLECLRGDMLLDREVIELVSAYPKKIRLYLSENDLKKELGEDMAALKVPAFDRLRNYLEQLTGEPSCMGFLPQAMSSDAKTSSVEKLLAALVQDGSGFEFRGDLDKASMLVTSDAPEPGGQQAREKEPGSGPPSSGGSTENLPGSLETAS